RVRQHGLDSSVNGLPYDRHGEELAVHEFANLIRPGMHQFLQQPVSLQLPCWSRLLSCSASLRDDLALAGSQGRQTRLVNVPLAPKPKMEVGRVQPAPWHQPAASGSAR
ncbi:MAG: glycosyl transferase, partial [Synechococcus sp.]